MNQVFSVTEMAVETNVPAQAVYKELQIAPQLTEVTISVRTAADTIPEVKFSFVCPNNGVAAVWSPTNYHSKRVPPDWDKGVEFDRLRGAPVQSCMAWNDENRLTVAVSDAENPVCIRCGIREETGQLACAICIRPDSPTAEYVATIRIDTRTISFADAVRDAERWWSAMDAYQPMDVPECARMPVYSTWYAFHHGFDAEKLLAECRAFHALGCRTLIVDGGWYKDNDIRGLGWSGDWRPAPSKFSDMRAFVDAVHAIGMRVMVWFGVPFVGIHAAAHDQWQDKMLNGDATMEAHKLDPRFPEVRAHLTDVYRSAVRDWDLDGVKLDFIDSFPQEAPASVGADAMSIATAVDLLLQSIRAALIAEKPNLMIEFRQRYIGPRMRKFANILRSTDCPCDSYTNRMNVLSLRLTSGKTAVHSDMVMWPPEISVEMAAFQLTNVLFSVPQISVRYDNLPETHRRMVTQYLRFWTTHRKTLLNGALSVHGYTANFTSVSARLGIEQIAVLYAGQAVPLDSAADQIFVVNATQYREIWLSGLVGRWQITVTDCMGTQTCSDVEVCPVNDVIHVNAPINGYIALMRIS